MPDLGTWNAIFYFSKIFIFISQKFSDFERKKISFWTNFVSLLKSRQKARENNKKLEIIE